MKRVFCIGNGESRKGFDLEQLRPHGKIYGCNALYRDFMPDVLIATDDKMREEILIPHLRMFEIKFLCPTNYRGDRVKITDTRFEKSVF